ncbi:MAG: aminodeoxychorismate lyase [Nevskia sp.]|nr:aminodeoxychorismate lyase [Nevskia sp.]
MTAAWFNGAPASAVDAFGRGLHYGDGVFRTLMKYDGEIIDIEEHIKKIRADAAGLGINPPEAAVLRADAGAAGAAAERCVLKILLLRAGGGRGYRPAGHDADRLVLRYPAPVYAAAAWEQGVAAFRCALKLAAQPALAGIKHLNRLEQVLASRDWPDGMDEGLLGDGDGAPVCGTRSNLFWVRRGRLHTPALDRCGVAGVMRDRVLALAARLGIQVQVAQRPWQHLLEADEAFVTNSLIGTWPLRSLDGHRWPAPGPLTASLAAALRHPRLI